VALAGCGDRPSGPRGHVIEIDIDDHGLSALWTANAPNLKGLITRGTLAFSRVDVPTHSNQNNMTLLTGQYPDGHDVPSNAWLSRAAGFAAPLPLPGLTLGDYVLYDKNPLRTRGDSVYRAVHDAGGRSAYVGQLPPFDVGADDVHLSIVGASLGGSAVDATTAPALLQDLLGYPADVVGRYHFDGPPATGETETRFTLRDAADLVRATGPGNPMPNYLFVWDFLALDDDPTSSFGADGAELAAIVEDYDAGIGELLAALDDEGLTASTNIIVTLDHGKVNAHNQVALGTRGGGGTAPADGQLAAVVTAQGAALGLDTTSYALLDEDGDALLYARVDGAGTAAGAAAQTDLAHRLVSLVQSGALVGVDTTRTMTADGWLGTRRFHDFRASGPNQADVILYPQDDWTLNQVDAANTAPGPFQEHTQYPYGRHGGFSVDELYVPLIMAGPAFKSGVLLPHPVEHADVAPTALAALGAGVALRTAARGPIQAALAGDPGETIALPSPPDGARDLVLAGSGFLGAVPPPAAPAAAVVVIDVAGLYEDELFADPKLIAAAAPLRALAARGTRFEDCWTRSRDWPVTEYQLLSGGYPVAPWFPAAEDDPAETVAPGTGLLAMPPAPGFVADPGAYAAWRAASVFPQPSLFDATGALGLTGALLGSPDFHALHLSSAAIAVGTSPAGAPLADELAALALAAPKLFAVIALGGPRTADRHDPKAVAELAALAQSVDDLVARVPNALVVITSRGATPIDDPGADFYGPGSSRHVPLVILGPGVRAGVVTGQPAAPADVPATILYALGAPTATDFALGTWAAGAAAQGVPQPLPAAATEGHALVRGFSPGVP
jgi:arylsulfatase A-like enzyme